MTFQISKLYEGEADKPMRDDALSITILAPAKKATGRQIYSPCRPYIAEATLPQNKLLNGVLGVMRVAVSVPVIVSVEFPSVSYD